MNTRDYFGLSSEEEMKDILRKRFNVLGLGERMASYVTTQTLISDEMSSTYLAEHFGDWYSTNEGFDFWHDVFYLLLENKHISTTDIKRLYEKHNISV